MITDKNQKKDLVKILNFALFSNTPIYVEGHEKKFKFRIDDVNEESFVMGPEQNLSLSFLSDKKNIHVSMGYNRKSLVFEGQVIKIDEHSDKGIQVFVQIPEFGELKNLRFENRYHLPENFEGKGSLFVKTLMGEQQINLLGVYDYSESAISFFIDRKEGLLLEGDLVKEIELSVGEKELFKGNGKIIRIDKKIHFQDNENSYLAVMLYHNKEKKEVIEVEDKKARDSERYFFIEEKIPSFVNFSHPFFNDIPIIGEIIDVSKSGISFLTSKVTYPIVPHMCMEVNVNLASGGAFKAYIETVYTKKIETKDGNLYQIGSKFKWLDLKSIDIINNLIAQKQSPDVYGATQEDFQQLWEFLFETGFIYKEKSEQLRPFAQKLMKTYLKLLNSKNNVCRKVFVKNEEGKILGHVAAIKYYDHTWLIQHLNAIKTEEKNALGKKLLFIMIDKYTNKAVNEYNECEYATFYFRPNNPYPSIVFGTVAKIINDKKICGTKLYNFCTLKEDYEKILKENNFSNEELTFRKAEQKDLVDFEDLLIEQKKEIFIRLESLHSEKLNNLEISKEYESNGLYRRRSIFVVEDQKKINKLYAVAEYASPGINLSELTNSIKMYSLSFDEQFKLGAGNLIMQEVLKTYDETEMNRPILLLDEGENVPLPFEHVKDYVYWYMSLDQPEMAKKAFNQVFDHFKEYLRERIKNEESRKKQQSE